LINYGDITDIGSAPQADSSVNTIRNFGRIGDIGLHNGDLLYNYADIAGSVSFVGNGFFKNSGTLHGDYNQDGVTGQQIVINKGDIYGDINLVVGNNSIDSSHGHVFGTMNGGLGNDTLLGGDNDDNIAGNGGEDLLKGGAGDDVLNGGSDKDRLFGGAGDDTLTGGSGRDTFIFSGNFGQDTVTDFTATGSSHDVIRFAHNDFADFVDLSPHMTQAGVDVHITLDATDSIVIQNVTLANLTSGDFLFG
jgi:Ca2+-binding RTX toxin-like protein